MSIPSHTEGDSLEAPLLDVQFGGPKRNVVPTISYIEFNMSSTQMQPLLAAVLRRNMCRCALPCLIVMAIAIYVVLVLAFTVEYFIGQLAFVLLLLIPVLLLVRVCRDRNYYNKHGAVRFAAMSWERQKWLRDLGLHTHPIQIDLASYHGARGDYQKAIDCYKQVFDHYSFLEENLGGTVLHKAIGRLCYVTGRYQEALDHFLAANLLRKRMQEQQQRDRLWFHETKFEMISAFAPTIYRNDYNVLGATYKALGRNEEALENFQHAVQILRDANFGRNIEFAVSLTKVGDLHDIIGNQNDALKVYREALEIHLLNEGEFPRTTAVARLHDKLGDLRCNDDGGDEDGETANGHWNIAVEVYRRAGKTDEDIEIIRLQSKLREHSSF